MHNTHSGRHDDSLSNETNERTGSSLIATLVATTTASVVLVGGLRWYYHTRRKRQSQLDEESQENKTKHEQAEIRRLQQQRKEERTGRIRAEVRLRTTLKQLQQLQLQLLQYQKANQHPPMKGRQPIDNEPAIQNDIVADSNGTYDSVKSRTETNNYENSINANTVPQPHRTMLLNSIGTVITPYTKRMGTPRQGALVPASRGYIQLHLQIPADVAAGLELYSHIWVLFEFHANTDLNSTAVDMMTDCKNSSNKNNTNSISNKTKKSKIRPPRGNGIKVGQLATRSPHRPNPLGLSLVTVERWDAPHKRLYISGIDIVNGTPVYDIKPVVPWDVPGYCVNQNNSKFTGGSTPDVADASHTTPVLRVPHWVSSTDDVIDTVAFTMTAQDQLQQCLQQGHLSPLYTIDNDGLIGAMTTIQQILAQDPRSSHKGLKSNARGTKVVLPPSTWNTNTGDKNIVLVDSSHNGSTTGSQHISSAITVPACYSLIFCNIKVSFTVTEQDGCCVMEVIPIEFDAHQYVDGVPIITEGLTLE